MKLGRTRQKQKDTTVEYDEQKVNADNSETPASDTDEASISVTNLCKSYGNHQVLDSVELKIHSKELFGLISKSGEGKTTLIDCITGATIFDKGSVRLNGFDLRKESLDAKNSFGYVSELPICYDSMTGYDYLEFIANVYQITEGDLVRNQQYLSERLDITDNILKKPIYTYSPSIKQKLCIIASLIHNPQIWILDNALALLDYMTVDTVKKMLREYANHGKTVLITASSVEIIAKICDKVAILNQGKIEVIYDLNADPNKRIQLSKLFTDVYRRR